MRQLPDSAGGILSYFTRHRTAANLLLLILIVVGLVIFPRMRAQFFPDVVVDNVSVSIAWDGAGAEDVDEAIVAVLEPVLLAVEGVTESAATSREGRATIRLEFEPGWDMGRAADEVQVAVDSVSTLPEDAEDPVVRRGVWRDRVTDVVISGPVGVDQLGRFADEFVARLFDQGVTRTTIRGVAAPEIMVEVPSAALIHNDVSMAEIAQAIGAEVDTSPAGDVTGANARVRTGVARRTAVDIAGIVLRYNEDGSALTIGDVATVTFSPADASSIVRLDGERVVGVGIVRQAGSNTIEISEGVRTAIEEVNARFPDLRLSVISDNAVFIRGAVREVLFTLGIAILVVIATIRLFSGSMRLTLIPAVAIPISLLGTMAACWLLGFSVNILTLLALVLATEISRLFPAVVFARPQWWNRGRQRHRGSKSPRVPRTVPR